MISDKEVTNLIQDFPQSSQLIDQWEFQYGTMNNQKNLALRGGLSAEICFAKYAAFKRQVQFLGYASQVPKLSSDEDFVQKTLAFIKKQIMSHKNNSTTALYSPGVCSVPYILQTTNFIYLPSHFLIGVTNIQTLKKILRKAKQAGYKCYAVVGHDPCLKNTLCAWIKFVQMPKQYIELIRELKITNIVVMACFNPKGNKHGSERTARLMFSQDKSSQSKKQRKMPKSGDIYMLYIQESYGKPMQKDIQIFSKYIQDVTLQEWQQLSKQPIVEYIHDWESGIDCLQSIQSSTTYQLNYEHVQFTYLLSRSSWDLYKIAYSLGKRFIEFNYDEKTNPYKAKGLVFNQYFMSNPTYQLGYGYVPVLYWQFYGQNQKRILQLITQDEQKYDLWFNIHACNKLPFSSQKLEELRSKNHKNKQAFIIKTNGKCIELGQWVTKHAKKSYDYVKFLSLEDVQKELDQQKLVYKMVQKFQR